MKILHFRKSHSDAVVELNREFDMYLGALFSIPREDFDTEANRKKLLRYGF